jgi:hypothetical protein
MRGSISTGAADFPKPGRGTKQALDLRREIRELQRVIANEDRAAIGRVDKIFASTGLTMEVVRSWTLAANIDAVERIDRMTMNAEARRSGALREIERHRSEIFDRDKDRRSLLNAMKDQCLLNRMVASSQAENDRDLALQILSIRMEGMSDNMLLRTIRELGEIGAMELAAVAGTPAPGAKPESG